MCRFELQSLAETTGRWLAPRAIGQKLSITGDEKKGASGGCMLANSGLASQHQGHQQLQEPGHYSKKAVTHMTNTSSQPHTTDKVPPVC
jgi:hypothetical protein